MKKEENNANAAAAGAKKTHPSDSHDQSIRNEGTPHLNNAGTADPAKEQANTNVASEVAAEFRKANHLDD